MYVRVGCKKVASTANSINYITYKRHDTHQLFQYYVFQTTIMIYIPTPSSLDFEYMVYALAEISVALDLPMYEMEVVNYIRSTFTTAEVIKALELLEPKASEITGPKVMEAPYVKIKKVAPNSWEVTLAGNQHILLDILTMLHKLDQNAPESFQKVTKGVPLKDWVPCDSLPYTSLLQLTPPESLRDILPEPEPGWGRPQTSNEIIEGIQLPKNKVTYIIGTAGNRIAQIRFQSGCDISIPPIPLAKLMQMRGLPGNEVYQQVIFRGTLSQVTEAKSLIRRLLMDYN